MKLFITKRIPGKEDCLLLRLLLGKEEAVGGLFQQMHAAAYRGIVEFVEDSADADYLFMPHNYFSVASNAEYLKEVDALAAMSNKKVIVFAYGDSTRPVKIKNSVVLRTSQYKSQLKANEIIIPPFVEHLGKLYGVSLRSKHVTTAGDVESRTKPVVGFAGWAGFSTQVRYIKYILKLLITFGPRRQGIYFRKRATDLLAHADLVSTNFKLRTSYSGHLHDIEDTPEKIRAEYVDVIQSSDFALAVRGDGNYSLRFFEILSLGRIPLFIDTDMALPLENEVVYDDCMLRVDYRDLKNLPQIVHARWMEMSEQEFVDMQRRAATVFETRLEASVFYRYIFSHFDAIVKNHEGTIR